MNPMQIFQMLQGAGNPVSMMQQMFSNNPMFQRAMQMLQGKDHNAQMEVLNNICKQKGINLQQLKQMFTTGHF